MYNLCDNEIKVPISKSDMKAGNGDTKISLYPVELTSRLKLHVLNQGKVTRFVLLQPPLCEAFGLGPPLSMTQGGLNLTLRIGDFRAI